MPHQPLIVTQTSAFIGRKEQYKRAVALKTTERALASPLSGSLLRKGRQTSNACKHTRRSFVRAARAPTLASLRTLSSSTLSLYLSSTSTASATHVGTSWSGRRSLSPRRRRSELNLAIAKTKRPARATPKRPAASFSAVRCCCGAPGAPAAAAAADRESAAFCFACAVAACSTPAAAALPTARERLKRSTSGPPVSPSSPSSQQGGSSPSSPSSPSALSSSSHTRHSTTFGWHANQVAQTSVFPGQIAHSGVEAAAPAHMVVQYSQTVHGLKVDSRQTLLPYSFEQSASSGATVHLAGWHCSVHPLSGATEHLGLSLHFSQVNGGAGATGGGGGKHDGSSYKVHAAGWQLARHSGVQLSTEHDAQSAVSTGSTYGAQPAHSRQGVSVQYLHSNSGGFMGGGGGGGGGGAGTGGGGEGDGGGGEGDGGGGVGGGGEGDGGGGVGGGGVGGAGAKLIW